jgi:hypothetical protein
MLAGPESESRLHERVVDFRAGEAFFMCLCRRLRLNAIQARCL